MGYPDRFWRTVRRLLAEVGWIRTEQKALEKLTGVEVIGGDFFHVAHTALHGDRLLRLIRVFEQSRKVASFWYLHRCAPGHFAAVDVDRLRTFSERLKLVRNKTFVHIDKDAVLDPQAVYTQAGVTGNEIVWAIETVWRELKRLHTARPSGEADYPLSDNYGGDDIATLMALRENHRSTQPIRKRGP